MDQQIHFVRGLYFYFKSCKTSMPSNKYFSSCCVFYLSNHRIIRPSHRNKSEHRNTLPWDATQESSLFVPELFQDPEEWIAMKEEIIAENNIYYW